MEVCRVKMTGQQSKEIAEITDSEVPAAYGRK